MSAIFESIDMNTFFNIFLIVGFLVLVMLRVPVAMSMLLTTFAYSLMSSKLPVSYTAQTMTSGIAKFTILAVPLFMTVGELMNSSGITRRLFDFANKLVGHIPGGLGHVNILASLFFAGVSGSANADCAGLGNIEITAMREKGYDIDFSVGITAASSIIGPIFPPSGPMIMFGTLASISVGSLFMGGVTIGVLITAFLMATVYIISKKRKFPVSPRASLKEVFKSFLKSFWALLLPVLMIWSLTTGVVSTTEVGALSIMYALFLGIVVYRELKWNKMKAIFERIVEMSGMIMLLIGGGTVFAGALGAQKLPAAVGEVLFSISSNPAVVMLIILAFLLFLGTFMETNAAILICIPLLLPIVQSMGYNTVQFGVTMVLALMIGLLTPPMAICLFITSKIGGISFMRAFKAVRVYYIAFIIILLMTAFIEPLTTWLPNLIYG